MDEPKIIRKMIELLPPIAINIDISPNDFQKRMAELAKESGNYLLAYGWEDSVRWSHFWTNVLAHEQIWLAASEHWDNVIGERFDVASGVQNVSDYCSFRNKSTKEIIQGLDLRQK